MPTYDRIRNPAIRIYFAVLHENTVFQPYAYHSDLLTFLYLAVRSDHHVRPDKRIIVDFRRFLNQHVSDYVLPLG